MSLLQVTRVVLFWVNNHFNDFETDPAMCEFLEHFECLLEREVNQSYTLMLFWSFKCCVQCLFVLSV